MKLHLSWLRFISSALIVLIASVLVSSVWIGPPPAAAQDPTPTPTTIRIEITNDAGANLRSGPGTEYAILDTVDSGASFDVLAFSVDGKGEIWYLVTLDGLSAWVADSVTSGSPLGSITRVTLTPGGPLPPTATPAPTRTPHPPPPLPPGANAWIDSTDRVRLRSGPGLNYPELDMLNPDTPLRLVAPFVRLKYSQDEPDVIWYLVKTVDGGARYGWVYSELIGTILADPAHPPTDPPPQAAPDAPTIEPLPGVVLPSSVLRSVRAVYRQGQTLGNDSAHFIVIGDSTSAGNEYTLPAFCAFRWRSYKLGRYEALQNTIDFFDSSFCANNLTLRSGFSTSHILDVLWADPALCQAGETPLECEYRRSQPTIAIIYIGLVDITYSTTDEFAENLDAILTFLIDHGVIPVLNTVPSSDRMTAARGYVERMEELNRIVRDAARRYRLPLIDLKAATYDLPNQGCIEEGFHLSYRVDGVLNFTGDEEVYGKDLRELLTLEMLHELRVQVIEGEG